MPNPWDKPETQSAGNPWDRPAQKDPGFGEIPKGQKPFFEISGPEGPRLTVGRTPSQVNWWEAVKNEFTKEAPKGSLVVPEYTALALGPSGTALDAAQAGASAVPVGLQALGAMGRRAVGIAKNPIIKESAKVIGGGSVAGGIYKLLSGRK